MLFILQRFFHRLARINKLQDFIKQQPSHLEAFDEALVKRWLERIIVWEDHFTVELKSGLRATTKSRWLCDTIL